jgi:ParB family chromosome partitioning protein
MQPRTHFDEGSLEGLADSIRSHGIVQPLLVRRQDERD